MADHPNAAVAGQDSSPGRSPAGTDPDKRRQILEGARRMFRAKGFDGASMGDVAGAAGVSKGTLYVYFPGKEELFHALVLEEKRAQAEALFRFDAADADVRGALRRLGVNFLEMVVRPENVSNIRMVIGAAEKFPEIGRLFYEAGPAQGARRLAAYLAAQSAAGRLRIADPATAAQHFVDLCQTGTMRRLLFAWGDPPDAAERERMVDEALRVFFAAYGP